jgi:hypothetical protein
MTSRVMTSSEFEQPPLMLLLLSLRFPVSAATATAARACSSWRAISLPRLSASALTAAA